MRCFYVVVHGTLEWSADHLENEDAFTPAGFHCHRYVLASGFEEAAGKAFRHIRRNLEKQTGWLKQGRAKLTLECEELRPAPLHKLLRRNRRVCDFYQNSVPANEE